jgi:hypothetical protein
MNEIYAIEGFVMADLQWLVLTDHVYAFSMAADVALRHLQKVNPKFQYRVVEFVRKNAT